MAYLLAPIPYFHCWVHKEYTQDLEAGAGEDLPALAVAVMCIRGDSLQFQVVMKEPLAGCSFMVPIEALTTKPGVPREIAKTVQPWDCFSSDFAVTEIEVHRRGAVRLLKDDALAEYRFTLCFTGSDLADDPGQRKLLHVVHRDDGLIGAYPNNRLVFLDRALFGDLTAKPEFTTLSHEFRAEGLVGARAEKAASDANFYEGLGINLRKVHKGPPLKEYNLRQTYNRTEPADAVDE